MRLEGDIYDIPFFGSVYIITMLGPYVSSIFFQRLNWMKSKMSPSIWTHLIFRGVNYPYFYGFKNPSFFHGFCWVLQGFLVKPSREACMKSWSSIKFHTLLLGQNKNSLMFVRKFSGVAWIHFKGKFQKKINSNILLKKCWIPTWNQKWILRAPWHRGRLFCQENGQKNRWKKSPVSFRLLRGLSEFSKRSCFLL